MATSRSYIVLFNRRYSELMGQSAESLRGLSLHDLFKHRKATGAFRGEMHEICSGSAGTFQRGLSSPDQESD
jgi:hypothetical protein